MDKDENIAKIYRHANRAIAAKKLNDPKSFIHEWKMFKCLSPELILLLLKEAGYTFIDEKSIAEDVVSYVLYSAKIED